MRSFVKWAGLGVAAFGMVSGAASAADREPESRAYIGFSFGGQEVAARDFRYGLQFDHGVRNDFRNSERQLPALVQLEYSSRGLSDFRVNGLSAVRQEYLLRQAEEEVIDDTGFFEGIGNWFSNLFGGDDDEDEFADSTADSGDVSDDDYFADTTDGAFLGYNAVDWGLVAAGAVGLGYIATEVVNGDDSVIDTGGEGTSEEGGSVLDNIADNVPGGDGLPDLPDLPGPGFAQTESFAGIDRAEHSEWLESGTGHMGDLELVQN